jgi:ribosomal protein L37AE/L43A
VSSKKPPKGVLARNKSRKFEERRRGSACERCGLLAKRRSDSYCSNCGIPLPGVNKTPTPTVNKAVIRAEVEKVLSAARTGVEKRASDLRAGIADLLVDTAAAEHRLAELEAMAQVGPYLPLLSKSVSAEAPADFDPLALLTVDGREPSTDPLLRAELNSHDPARREAAWQAVYGKQA